VHIRLPAPIRANFERVESHGVHNTAMTSSACRPGWRYSPPPFSKCFCCVSCISGFTISLRSVCGLHRALRATRRALRATRLALTANRLHPASFSIPACGAPGEQRSLSARMRAPVSTHACAHATRAPAEPNRARTPAEPPDPTTLQFLPSWPRHRKVLLGLKPLTCALATAAEHLPLPQVGFRDCRKPGAHRAARAQCCSNRSLRAPAASPCPVAESVLAYRPAPAPAGPRPIS